MSDSDLFQDFIGEARQQLESVEECLLAMARAPTEQAVQACFRGLHTLKGNSGFFPLPRIQRLAHVAEQLLDAIRCQVVPCDGQRVDVLLVALSQLSSLVDGLANGSEAAGEDEALKAQLQALSARGESPPPAPHTTVTVLTPITAPAPVLSSSTRTSDACLAELVAIDLGDIAALVKLMNELRRLAATTPWPAPAQTLFGPMDDLCSELVLGMHADAGAAWQRMFAWTADLHQALGGIVAAAAHRLPTAPAAVAIDSGLLEEFVHESGELLGAAEHAALDGGEVLSGEAITLVFRSFHTVKGMAAYLALPRLEAFAHAIEDRLTPGRDGLTPVTPDTRQFVLSAVDALREVIKQVWTSRRDDGPLPVGAAALVAELGLGTSAPAVQAAAIASAKPVAKAVPATPNASASPAAVPAAPSPAAPAPASVAGAPTKPAAAPAKPAEGGSGKPADGIARVSTTRLDELMNLVGELLIAHSMVAQNAGGNSQDLTPSITRQGRIIRELQAMTLGLRMVPLRATFQKMARAVHDTSRKLGKQIEFEASGDETELDRTLAEAVADPLLHMMRNAVDHGIESAEDRQRAGKPPIGKVTLSARQTTDFVEIQLRDDGRGMDPARLKAKAVEKGLIPADKPMSDSECFNLIFLPGFSTAAVVTDVSGRGVGMDVVRRNVEAASGRVEIQSRLGQGSTFILRLPLTTAIVDAMLLRVAGERFLVPIGGVIELLNPRAEQVQSLMGRGRVVESRKRLLPIVSIGEVFGIPGHRTTIEDTVLLVVEGPDRQVALQVDEVIGQQQVVVKPLDTRIGYARGLAGSAILGDGRVGLILDPIQFLTAHGAPA